MSVRNTQERDPIQSEFAGLFEWKEMQEEGWGEKIKAFLDNHPGFDLNRRVGPLRTYPIYYALDLGFQRAIPLVEVLLQHDGAHLNPPIRRNEVSPTVAIIEKARYIDGTATLNMALVHRIAHVFKRYGAQLSQAEYTYVREQFGVNSPYIPLDCCNDWGLNDTARELLYLFPVKKEGSSSCVLV